MNKKLSEYFFNNSPYWEYNACIPPGFWREYGEYNMLDGYFYSANILAGSILHRDFINETYKTEINEDTGEYFYDVHKDTLIYPIVFNYRHYIELFFKFTIRKILFLIDQEADNKLKEKLSQHKLSPLYNIYIQLFKQLVKEFNLESDTNTKSLKKYHKLLNQVTCDLDSFDEGSLAIRYIENKDDIPYFKEQKLVNILEFADKMQEVRNVFNNIDYLLSGLSDLNNEITY
jgi:hypothetical protein